MSALDQLREIADEAQQEDPGRWFTEAALEKLFFIPTECRFFATFSPTTVQALLDVCGAAQDYRNDHLSLSARDALDAALAAIPAHPEES